MLKENKNPSEAGTLRVINFDEYRINSPSEAPFGAKIMRFTWGGEDRFQNYCKAYNDLVSALEDCVNHGDIDPDEAKQRLEKSRKF